MLSPMKKLSSKITMLASILAVAGMFTVPAVRAADDAEKAAKKKKKAEADLKKYDKNANGKLDPEEIAILAAGFQRPGAPMKRLR